MQSISGIILTYVLVFTRLTFGTLTESKCSLAAYEFFKYVEPVLIKALNIIDNALEQAEEDGDEEEVAEMTSMQKVGGIQADMSKRYYVLSWKEGVYGDKTVTASLDPKY